MVKFEIYGKSVDTEFHDYHDIIELFLECGVSKHMNNILIEKNALSEKIYFFSFNKNKKISTIEELTRSKLGQILEQKILYKRRFWSR